MFEDMNENEAREEILRYVDQYCRKYHNRVIDGLDTKRIPYAGRIYDSDEMVNLVDSALEFWLTSGHYTQQLENDLANFLGIKYCSLVNSGSSANLLAFMTLTSPMLGERAIRRGDEVITVAAGFPTTVAPIIQFGAVPVFVDVTIPQYNIDVDQIELALSSKSKAVMLAHTLGNPFNIKQIKEFCQKNKLWLIEDNCDALGSRYCLDGKWQYTGTFGDIGTSSFYPPHHITMGEGGAVYTNDPLLHKIIRSMRDWGRDCECPSGVDNLCGHRFNRQFGDLPLGYDHKYVYSHFGYNLKATDMQAAVGCAQLKKLPQFINARIQNHKMITEGLAQLKDRFILPEALTESKPSWFGFLLTCTDKCSRNELVKHLESKGIQTRMLFAGNLLKHPCFVSSSRDYCRYRSIGDLKNTERIMNNTFWIGVYPGLNKAMITKIINELLNC